MSQALSEAHHSVANAATTNKRRAKMTRVCVFWPLATWMHASKITRKAELINVAFIVDAQR
jgi:hypothetical protein